MPDQGEEAHPKQVNPPETTFKKETETGTFKHVIHRGTEGGRNIDVSGIETSVQGASLNLAEIFAGSEDESTVYFETVSGTIYKISKDVDSENRPTLILQRSNKPDQPIWAEISGQVEVGKGFGRMCWYAKTNMVTSIETNTVSRAALFGHSVLTSSSDAQSTDIIDKFEHDTTAHTEIFPHKTSNL